MTRPARTVIGAQTLLEASTRLAEAGVSGLPVVDARGSAVGVLSQQDVLRVLHQRAGLALPAGLFALLLPVAKGNRERLIDDCQRALRSVHVHEAMSHPAITVPSGESVDEAIRLLLRHRINRLPVTERGRVVGIVTRTDLLARSSAESRL